MPAKKLCSYVQKRACSTSTYSGLTHFNALYFFFSLFQMNLILTVARRTKHSMRSESHFSSSSFQPRGTVSFRSQLRALVRPCSLKADPTFSAHMPWYQLSHSTYKKRQRDFVRLEFLLWLSLNQTNTCSLLIRVAQPNRKQFC